MQTYTHPIMIDGATHPVVVTGKLVQEPNLQVKRWCKIIMVFYSLYYIYILSENEVYHHDFDFYIWFMQFSLIAIAMPVCGIRASDNSQSAALGLFGAMQFILAAMHGIALISFCTMAWSLLSLCDSCKDELVNSTSVCRRGHVNWTIQKCNDVHPDIEDAVFCSFMFILTFVSCAGAWATCLRKKPALAHVVTVESRTVPPIIGTMHQHLQPPEDCYHFEESPAQPSVEPSVEPSADSC